MAKSTRFRHKKLEVAPQHRTAPPLLLGILIVGKAAAIMLSPLRPLSKFVLLGLSLWLGVGALVFGYDYMAYRSRLAVTQAERATQRAELSTWQHVLANHPTSREALLGAYSSSLSLGNSQDANRYLELLRRVDPNDVRVKSL